MIRSPRRIALAVTALAAPATLLAGVVGAAPSASAAAGCTKTSGVNVVVSWNGVDGKGGTTVRCAPGNPTSAWAALKAAGFSTSGVQQQPGFLCRINGSPSQDPCVRTPPQSRYWAFWTGQPGSSWSYSTLGVGSFDPPPGTAVGFSFGAGAAPGVKPPAVSAPQPSPTPTKTATPTSSPKPTSTPKPSSSKPSSSKPTSAKSSTPAKGTSSAKSSASASAQPNAGAGGSSAPAASSTASSVAGSSSAASASGSSPTSTTAGSTAGGTTSGSSAGTSHGSSSAATVAGAAPSTDAAAGSGSSSPVVLGAGAVAVLGLGGAGVFAARRRRA